MNESLKTWHVSVPLGVCMVCTYIYVPVFEQGHSHVLSKAPIYDAHVVSKAPIYNAHVLSKAPIYNAHVLSKAPIYSEKPAPMYILKGPYKSQKPHVGCYSTNCSPPPSPPSSQNHHGGGSASVCPNVYIGIRLFCGHRLHSTLMCDFSMFI